MEKKIKDMNLNYNLTPSNILESNNTPFIETPIYTENIDQHLIHKNIINHNNKSSFIKKHIKNSSSYIINNSNKNTHLSNIKSDLKDNSSNLNTQKRIVVNKNFQQSKPKQKIIVNLKKNSNIQNNNKKPTKNKSSSMTKSDQIYNNNTKQRKYYYKDYNNNIAGINGNIYKVKFNQNNINIPLVKTNTTRNVLLKLKDNIIIKNNYFTDKRIKTTENLRNYNSSGDLQNKKNSTRKTNPKLHIFIDEGLNTNYYNNNKINQKYLLTANNFFPSAYMDKKSKNYYNHQKNKSENYRLTSPSFINKNYLYVKKMLKKEENLKKKDVNLSMSEQQNIMNKTATFPFYRRYTSVPNKSFKFLVHEATSDKNIRESFCRYYNFLRDEGSCIFNMSYEKDVNSSIGSIHFPNNNIKNDLKETKHKNSNSSSKLYKKANIQKNVLKKKNNNNNNDDIYKNTTNLDEDQKVINTYNNCDNVPNKIINNNTYNTTLNFYNDPNKNNIDNNNQNIELLKRILPPHPININDNKENLNDNLITSQIPSPIPTPKICDIEIFYNLEIKILNMLNKINNYNVCQDECRDYIDYYFKCNTYDYIIKLFNNNHNKNNIINYLKIEILCYLLCYDISFDKYFNQAALLIRSIINIIHDNFLLLIKFIISEYSTSKICIFNEKNNQYIIPLKNIISNHLTMKIEDKNINEFSIIQLITDNTKNINNYYIMILDNLYKSKKEKNAINIRNKNLYKFPGCIGNYDEIFEIGTKNKNDININDLVAMFFFDSYRLLNNYNIGDLKKFFDLFLDRLPPSLSNSARSEIKEEKINTSPIFNNDNNMLILPKLDKKKYKFTLVLELNETLVYMNKNSNNVVFRQGMFNFLNEMKKIYELIIFSSENNFLVENTVNDIEKNDKFFDYVLDRKYGNEENGIFIKDLNILNRDVKNVVIIDVNKQYYNKNWEKNCICIKQFFGDVKDEKIMNLLGQLLKNIKFDADLSQDIRISINKYKKSFAYLKVAK